MKKTIIASAVAAAFAAPVAFADVTISGQLNTELETSSGGNSDYNGVTNADIAFKFSEDLGNGLKLFGVMAQTYDTDAQSSTQTTTAATIAVSSATIGASVASAASSGHTHAASASTTTVTDNNNVAQADMYVGISGDFGSIQAGRFEPYMISSIGSMMNIDAAEEADIEITTGQGRDNGVIRYTSPSMNGLTVGIEGVADRGTTGENFSTTAIFGQYSNAGLLVRAAQETQNAAAGSTDTKITSVGVSYTIDGLEGRVVYVDDDNGSGADETTTFYGVAYTMGANTISYGKLNGDVNDGDSIIGLKHAMSKNTSVYVSFDKDDSADTDKNTVVGIQHKF
jgi:predicted porin